MSANKYLSTNIHNTVSYANAIVRTSGQPLQKDGFYNNLSEALTYAQSGNAYVGQLINVVEDNRIQGYQIANEDGLLYPVKYNKQCCVGSDDANSAGWYKVADGTVSQFEDLNLRFYVCNSYNSGANGILVLHLRSDNHVGVAQFGWMNRHTQLSVDCCRLLLSGYNWSLYCYVPQGQWGRMHFQLLNELRRQDNLGLNLTLYESRTKEPTDLSGAHVSTDLLVTGNINPVRIYDVLNNVTIDDTWGTNSGGSSILQLETDDGAAFKLKKDTNAISPKLNVLLDGTLYVNEGVDKVLAVSDLYDSVTNQAYLNVPYVSSKVTSTAPSDYFNKFKFRGCANLTDIGYCSLVGMNSWSDHTGGGSHELAFSSAGIYHRIGSNDSTWHSWHKIAKHGESLSIPSLEIGPENGTYGFIDFKDGTGSDHVARLCCDGGTLTYNHINGIQAQKFNALSDARLKENFQPLVTTNILDLPVYKFDYINGAKNQIGCKAQDLQKICPEIVDENSDGYLSIQESKIVYLLLEEVKKLRKEINELKLK